MRIKLPLSVFDCLTHLSKSTMPFTRDDNEIKYSKYLYNEIKKISIKDV